MGDGDSFLVSESLVGADADCTCRWIVAASLALLGESRNGPSVRSVVIPDARLGVRKFAFHVGAKLIRLTLAPRFGGQ